MPRSSISFVPFDSQPYRPNSTHPSYFNRHLKQMLGCSAFDWYQAFLMDPSCLVISIFRFHSLLFLWDDSLNIHSVANTLHNGQRSIFTLMRVTNWCLVNLTSLMEITTLLFREGSNPKRWSARRTRCLTCCFMCFHFRTKSNLTMLFLCTLDYFRMNNIQHH